MDLVISFCAFISFLWLCLAIYYFKWIKVLVSEETAVPCTSGSLILRRSRSLAVTHSLPSPSDGLHSRSCSWRHNALVLFAPIATLLRIGQKWHLRARYSKLYFLKFLISENMLHSIWLAERKRASWRHEHDLEWSRECVTLSDLDRLRIRLRVGWLGKIRTEFRIINSDETLSSQQQSVSRELPGVIFLRW